MLGRHWKDILKILKENGRQPILPYPVKIFFKKFWIHCSPSLHFLPPNDYN
jgi:hypothetical protein